MSAATPESVGRPRSAGRNGKSRSLGIEDLTPGADLQPLGEGQANAWRSTGAAPVFAVAGPLPAGWLRLRVRVRRLDRQRAEREQAELHADYGEGFDAGACLERFSWTEVLADEVFLRLPRPARALCFRPLEGAGAFVVEEFRAEPLTRRAALRQALARKLALLRAYRCTGRVLLRGLGLVVTGRFGEVWRKVFKGLSDARLMRPENDYAPEAYAAWWRRRGLSDMDRERLRAEGDALPHKPTLTVLLPLDRVSEPALRLVVESVRRQVYPNWELVVAVSGATAPMVRVLLDRYAVADPRIRSVAPARGMLEAVCAAALEQVRTPHVVILNQGYELAEAALLRVAQRLNHEPGASLIANRVAPQAGEGEAVGETAEVFRAGAGGQQLNVFRTADVRATGFRKLRPGAAPGVELARRLAPSAASVAYLPDVLTYPASSIAPVQLAPDPDAPVLPLRPSAARSRPLLVTGNIVGISGYDYFVFELVRGLHSLGVDVRLNSQSRHRPDLIPPYFAPLIRPRRVGDWELVVAPPHLLGCHPHPAGCVVFTMWESDRLERAWVRLLNEAALVAVPSRWAVESFRASGVTVPMAVVPLGHEPLTFHPDGSRPTACTFGTAGALWGGGLRKNVRRVIDLFQRAFPDETDVRLRVKVTPRCELPDSDDPRVEVLRAFLTPSDLADWHRSLSAYVNASAAEGFGLHLVEAMACGVPLISTAYSAVTEYFDAAVGYPVAHRVVPADGQIYQGCWAEPDDDALVAAMRAVYRDPDGARRRGERAAARARRFTWKEAGRRLLAVLEEHAGRGAATAAT